MKLLYKFIFENSRWWWGKLSAGALIGGIVLGGAAVKTKEGFVKDHALDFAILGGVIGFVAALILMLNDFRQGVNVDDATHPDTHQVVPARKSFWPVVVGLVCLSFLTVVLYGVWHVWRLTHR